MASSEAELLARVPTDLRDVFARSARSRRILLLGFALVGVAVGVGVMVFQFSPPLSNGEEQGIGIGAGLCVVGLGMIAYTLKTVDPPLTTFVEGTIAYLYLRRGKGRQWAMLGTPDALEAPLRLDQDGVALDPARRDQMLAAIAQAHPNAVMGPQPSGPAQGESNLAAFTKRKRFFTAIMLALAAAVGVAGSFVAHAIDPSNGPLTAETTDVEQSGDTLWVKLQCTPGAMIYLAETKDGESRFLTSAGSDGHARAVVRREDLPEGATAVVLRVSRGISKSDAITVEVPLEE